MLFRSVLLGDVGEGQSLNPYAYVSGNPVSYVDPLGLRGEGTTGFIYDYSYIPTSKEYMHNTADGNYCPSYPSEDINKVIPAEPIYQKYPPTNSIFPYSTQPYGNDEMATYRVPKNVGLDTLRVATTNSDANFNHIKVHNGLDGNYFCDSYSCYVTLMSKTGWTARDPISSIFWPPDANSVYLRY